MERGSTLRSLYRLYIRQCQPTDFDHIEESSCTEHDLPLCPASLRKIYGLSPSRIYSVEGSNYIVGKACRVGNDVVGKAVKYFLSPDTRTIHIARLNNCLRLKVGTSREYALTSPLLQN